ncbi:MAG: hypothetical protein ACTSPX_04325, partial [Candidatus Thorarchaeota archaeon]
CEIVKNGSGLLASTDIVAIGCYTRSIHPNRNGPLISAFYCARGSFVSVLPRTERQEAHESELTVGSSSWPNYLTSRMWPLPQ